MPARAISRGGVEAARLAVSAVRVRSKPLHQTGLVQEPGIVTSARRRSLHVHGDAVRRHGALKLDGVLLLAAIAERSLVPCRSIVSVARGKREADSSSG